MQHQCLRYMLNITTIQTIKNSYTPKENSCNDKCREHYEKTLHKVNFCIKWMMWASIWSSPIQNQRFTKKRKWSHPLKKTLQKSSNKLTEEASCRIGPTTTNSRTGTKEIPSKQYKSVFTKPLAEKKCISQKYSSIRQHPKLCRGYGFHHKRFSTKDQQTFQQVQITYCCTQVRNSTQPSASWAVARIFRA